MANDLTFNQLATVLNAITKQATGQTGIAVVDTSTFITQAQTTLKQGYDPVIKAISQVLSGTVFSVRPYSAKLSSLRVSNQKYGNHVRKLTAVDKEFENDNRMLLEDGQSIDQYKINKPGVLQTNFYGAEVFEKSLTIFKDQLDCAFTTPDEFGRFLSMVMSNASDQIEQAHETTARATLVNFIAGKISASNGVIHLLTEYNTLTGGSYTKEDLMKPENLVPFTKWMYARINSLSDMMTERSQLYHVNITGKEVSRHTPKKNQKMYMYNQFMRNIDSSVLSDIFNQDKMKIGAYESVGYWQSIESPQEINVTPSYIDSTGAVQKGSAVNNSDVIGVLMDEEAVGITTVNQWSMPSPFNSSGGYYNQFWHFTDRFWNDLTENGLVFMLD